MESRVDFWGDLDALMSRVTLFDVRLNDLPIGNSEKDTHRISRSRMMFATSSSMPFSALNCSCHRSTAAA